jgi:hypothetical protein
MWTKHVVHVSTATLRPRQDPICSAADQAARRPSWVRDLAPAAGNQPIVPRGGTLPRHWSCLNYQIGLISTCLGIDVSMSNARLYDAR